MTIKLNKLKTKIHACFNCGALANELISTEGPQQAQLQTGDYIICINCNCINIYSTAIGFRAPLMEEREVIANSSHILNCIKALQEIKQKGNILNMEFVSPIVDGRA